MRLQLIAAAYALAAMLVARAAEAQPMAKIDTRSGIYQDTDRTTIVTTNVAARANPTAHIGIDARYLVDVITSASVDVISAATGAFHETRHEAEGALRYQDDHKKLGAAYVYSVENDWRSHTGNASFAHDFAHHAVTLKLAGSYVANEVGRSGDANFHRRLSVAGGTAGAAFVLSPRDLLDASYTASLLDGFQSSPYRFVSFKGSSGAPLSPFGLETHPDVRLRHAVTLRWNRHLFADTALRSHVRAYGDDWGVVSVTAGTEYVVGWGPMETGLFVRGYAQQHASFYKSEYAQPMRFMSADRELSTFVDTFAGGRVAWRKAHAGPLEDLHVEAKLSGFYFRFFDFPRLRERSGLLAEIALGVSF